jgi:phage gp46-like protein
VIGTDIALEWNNGTNSADVVIEANDLRPDDGLRTAVYLSLFTNAPAHAGDVLPDGAIAGGGEGGWWADALPLVAGDVVGSRLWLLDRCAQTIENLTRSVTYAREGLDWMLTDRVAGSLNVTSEFIPDGLGLDVTIHRPGGGAAHFRFDRTWTAEVSR